MKERDITLLYVDDEELNHFIFQKSFEGKYNIFTANSGAQGLEILAKYGDRIIVVISDMRMPLMNGVEFIKLARQEYANISYYILTGFEYNEEIESAMKENIVNEFFTKPFDISKIDEAIRKSLNAHQN